MFGYHLSITKSNNLLIAKSKEKSPNLITSHQRLKFSITKWNYETPNRIDFYLVFFQPEIAYIQKSLSIKFESNFDKIDFGDKASKFGDI